MDTHGLNILVEPKEAGNKKRDYSGQPAIAQWVMDHVDYWETYRNTNYLERWDEYYRIWRSEWSEGDKQRQVERSKIMPTDLSEKVSQTVAELSDAFFGRATWIDIDDNVGDENKEDVKGMAALLREDAAKCGIQSEVDKAFFNGALYGTGILKVLVTEKEVPEPTVIVDNFGRQALSGVTLKTQPYITAVSINPREFVIDPVARSVDDALGCAHIISMPRHTVLDLQRRGIFRKGDVGDWGPQNMSAWTVELSENSKRERVRVVEYHGLVPKALLPSTKGRKSAEVMRKIAENSLDDSVEMVEAIVTIANDGVLLKAIENPFVPQRRSIFAYQHETVADSFWGRGVIEMGYHPYKALQTEIRARADGLALANYPTVWRDEASLPGDQVRDDPDEKIIAPGKEYLVSGDPNRAIREFKFSGPDRNSSVAIRDYQQMIESATGSFGFHGAMLSSKDTTVAGSTIALQTFLRRSKRTALNIERDLLSPLIEALAWRSMQYMPDRYPPIDFSFKPVGALGILQRDAERATLVELLQAIPPESPSFAAILRLIVESGPYEQRAELLAILDSEIATRLQPPAPPPDPGGEARLISAQHRIKEHEDQMMLELEKLKRTDVELLIKAKGASNETAQQ